MEKQVFQEIGQYSPDRYVHVPVFEGERTKVILLCLSAGLSVPPHSHPGFEITLQPLCGKAVLPTGEGNEMVLKPGEIYFFADGAKTFNPKNPFSEPFQMLIHLVKK